MPGRFDTHLQLIDPSAQRAGAVFTYGFDLPVQVNGLQKLVNRWLKCFFTPKGSHPLRPTEGTDFPYLIGGNNVTDLPTLQTSVSIYLDDASDQIKAIDQRSPWLTNDERLRAVNLLAFNQLGPTQIEFWVQVINIAGQGLKMPIPAYAAG